MESHQKSKRENIKRDSRDNYVWFLLLTDDSIQLGWLILCVNLAELRDAQIADKTFLGESVRVFVEEIGM